LIELMIVMLSWMRGLPVDLYPGAPPSVQIRGKPVTDPLNRGISQQWFIENACPRMGEILQRVKEVQHSTALVLISEDNVAKSTYIIEKI
jgi:hypothetical protein